MNYISITFFSVSLLILFTALPKGADVFSPSRVFGFTWSTVFALTNLKFSGLQSDWTLLQWTYALMGPISFLTGLFVTYVMNMRSKLLPVSEIRNTLRRQKVHHARLFYLILVVYLTYLVGYAVIFLVKGNVPFFAANPGAARTSFSIFGFGLFLHHVPVVVFFSLVYLLVAHGERWKRFVVKMVILTSILTYALLLQRYHLIMITVMAFAFLYYATRYIRFSTTMLFAATGLLVIYSIATARVGQFLQLALYKSSLMRFPPEYAVLTEPYMYVVMNIENFVHAVTRLEQHTFGYYTFNFLLALTGLKHWIQNYFGIVDTPFLFSGYNTYTIFWTFFRDFGVIGISIVPLILGLVTGSVYYAMRHNPSIGLLSVYSIIVFLMALSFFINLLGYLWFVYIVVWMMLILRLVHVRRSDGMRNSVEPAT
jgi:oligosaccharide repeat unit polymerase